MKMKNERGFEQLLKKASSTYVEEKGEKIIEEANQLNKQSGEPLPENYTKFIDDLFTDNQNVQFNKSKEKKERNSPVLQGSGSCCSSYDCI